MKKKRNTFKILWNYLKDEKLKLLLYLILVILTVVPEAIGPYFWGVALDKLIKNDFYGFIINLGLWVGIFILCYSLLQLPKDLLYNKLENNFSKSVSKDLYRKITNLPSIAFEDIGVGEFTNRMYTDPDRIIELLSKLIRMICKFIVVIFVVIFTFKLSLIMGIEIIIFSIIMGFISYFFFPKIKKSQEKVKEESDKYIKSATENLTGIREIKALGIKRNIEKLIFKNIDDMFKNTNNIRKYEVIYHNLNNLTYFILEFIILATGGYLVIKGNLTMAIFVTLESYIWRIDDVVETLSDFGVNYNKVKVSLNRIDDIINNRLYKDEKFGTKELSDNKGIIEFNNVKFKYKEDEEYTLKGLDLKIEPNKKIAIVGKSGNGKSTIFNLLLRYFDPTKGSIKLDGIDIKDLTEDSLRDNISIIRQSPFLFNLSILDNFRLVKDDVTLEDVRKVCKEAYIDDYIMSLPNKYETIIGEGGINLSGGQKQRIAIARTLLINTKVILFDEATSALDNESQEYIKKTINNLVKDHTIIIVAHRLSTIMDADIINVIDKGTLVGSGNHKELLKECSLYSNLYTKESEI